MCYYPELCRETDVAKGPDVRAVGWLSIRHPFVAGQSAEAFTSKLNELCAKSGISADVLRFAMPLGMHECQFCVGHWAAGCLAVPGESCLYVAPEMVGHYVVEHGYRPPDEFVSAVMASPLPGTPEYRSLIGALQARRGWRSPPRYAHDEASLCEECDSKE